jgi:SAM-dependent methyltransferase
VSTRHIAAETARLHDLTPERVSGRASKRFRQRLASDGFTVDEGFRLKPGYLYTVVRAISARVNQNYDGWPSDELKKSYKTFIGKPCFVNHENHDPTKARGVVVAARYAENGMDKYIEVVQEIDANRFPKLAHEIKTGGLDSVSMGAEAGFTICSYCHNKATDTHDMCDHVIHHKGKTLSRLDRKTGKREDVLVFESCHKISFFELSYVFEPADETAVASKVVVAGLARHAETSPPAAGSASGTSSDGGNGAQVVLDTARADAADSKAQNAAGGSYELGGAGEGSTNVLTGDPSKSFDCSGIAGEMMNTLTGKPTDGEAATDSTGTRFNTTSDFEAMGFEPGAKPGAFNLGVNPKPGADGHMSVQLPSGANVESSGTDGVEYGSGARGVSDPAFTQQWHLPGTERSYSAPSSVENLLLPGYKQSSFAADLAAITKLAGECPPGADCNNMPDLNKLPNAFDGAPATNVSSTSGGKANSNRLLPGTQALNDALSERFPGTEIGGYREDPAYPDEHPAGKALDFMTTDIEVGNQALQTGWEGGADYAIWQNKMHYPDGTTKPYTGPNPHTDHVHFHHPGTAPAQRAAGKYTKDDFNHPSGMKPWEREKESDAEDAAAIEIEAMLLRTAMPFNPHSQNTQRRNTFNTNLKAEAFMDKEKAPNGRRLDFGAGEGLTGPPVENGGLGYETYEPHPHPQKFVGGEPTHLDISDSSFDGAFDRIQSTNVLNVLEPGDDPGNRHHAISEIGRLLAPGGHAVITARPASEVMRSNGYHYADEDDNIIDEPNSMRHDKFNPKTGETESWYQKGYANSGELADEVSGVLGDGYHVSPVNGIGPTGVHIVRHHITASMERSGAVKRLARQRALRLAFGETEAPMSVDTLREEGSAPEDDNNDFERFVEPPADLQEPDLSEAGQIDRQQEEAGAPTDQTGGVPGAAEGGPQGPQQQYMTLQIPIPGGAPQVPQQAAPPQMAQPPMPTPEGDPAAQPPQQIAASLLNYFDDYYGRRVANWMDAIEARRDMNPAEIADYRRQAGKLSTLENGREHSTTNRNPTKGTAKMARNSIASRNKVATTGRRRHYAEGPLVDGGDRSRNDQGEQEEAFLSQTPPEVSGDYVTGEHPGISNTEHSLVARVQQGREQLLRDARQLAAVQQRRALTESGGPTAVVVNPTVNAGPGAEALTGTDFVSADPNDGVVPTNPKDASLRAFQAFDGWLAQKTGKSSRRHTESNIKKAAAAFTREAGISPQMLFPALGIVLREARKNDKAKKGASMRKRSNESLEVAAPDGRIDVQAPVSGTTDAEAQASQFDLHDFGQNAGDSVAKPDLSTDQNWAPGEASGNKTSAVKTAGGLLAMRCAEGMIEAGLEPNSRERKYQLAAEFERMNRGLIQDRVALLERFASVRQADLRRVASGSSRGAARSPIPAGLGGGTRTAAAGMRTAANDPSNDSSLFI